VKFIFVDTLDQEPDSSVKITDFNTSIQLTTSESLIRDCKGTMFYRCPEM